MKNPSAFGTSLWKEGHVSMSFWEVFMGLRKDKLHVPYNPALVERAKALRKNMTAAERKLWFEYLRQLPVKVYRQRPMDHYIVDFFVPN